MWTNKLIAKIRGVEIRDSKPGLIEEALGAKSAYYVGKKGQAKRFTNIDQAYREADRKGKKRH